MIYCWFTSNWKYFFDNIWDLYFLLSCFLNAIWKTTFKMDFVPLWLVLERDYSNAMAVLKIIYLQKITIHATKINCKGSPDNGVLFSVIFGTDCPMSQVLIIIIFSTDAFARQECSLLLPPVKEGSGIIQLWYAPRS